MEDIIRFQLLDDKWTLRAPRPTTQRILAKNAPANGMRAVIVNAKDLRIVHGDNPRYWKWKTLPEMPMVEVAELLDVCWLEVTGKYDMKVMAPDITYEVAFVIKIEKNINFDSSVKFTLTLPDNKQIVEHVNLMKLQGNTNCLIFVKMGHVKGTGCGEIKFSLTNLSSLWKRGITIVGVCIEPARV